MINKCLAVALTKSKPAARLKQMRMQINRNYKQMKAKPVTPQRRLLLGVMQETGGHLDAKELYRRVSEKDASISLATVYRNPRLLRNKA